MICIIASNLNLEIIEKNSIRLDMLIIISFGVLLILLKYNLNQNKNTMQKSCKEIIILIIIVLNLINVMYNAKYSMEKIRVEVSRINQPDYSIVVNKYKDVLNVLKEYDKSTYRLEKNANITPNDSLCFGYNGIGYSGSAYSKSLIEFLRNMGVRHRHVHLDYNAECTKVVDMLLGIKYMIELKTEALVKEYQKIEDYQNMYFEIFKNPYYLGLGYSVGDKAINSNQQYDTNDTFYIQNDILKKLTNIDEEVYIKHRGEIIESNRDVKLENGNYVKIEFYPALIYEFEVESEENLYVYLVAKEQKKSRIFINGEEKRKCFVLGNNEMINLGKRRIGEKIRIEIALEEKELYIEEIYAYYENSETFLKHYNKLKESAIDIEEISSREFKGIISANEDNTNVMFTIPYEEGWKIEIDGEVTSYSKVLDTFIRYKSG
ncbi:MAG: YfhO family protein [Clostridia bacterium]|nr:YfhO family protein [Clostridia bacterium]